MAKKLKSQVGEDNGYNYFQKLPDELVILIFTKLSTATGTDTLEEDIKSLVQCSLVSKRFNALNSQVPTLSISDASINSIDTCFPKIINKFKHLRSLHVKHFSTTETDLYDDELKNEPFVFWEAIYEPNKYCLAVVSCTSMEVYSNLQQHASLMHSAGVNHDEEKLRVSNRDDTFHMFFFHHMLVSSIREHKMLERVVVSNIMNPKLGNFTLQEDMLVKLRNCTRINLEQVQTRDRSGSADILDIPLEANSGLVMTNVFFSIIEWWIKAPDQINKDDDDYFDDRSIPKALHFKGALATLLKNPLKRLLENRDDGSLKVDCEITNELLSILKSDGNLL